MSRGYHKVREKTYGHYNDTFLLFQGQKYFGCKIFLFIFCLLVRFSTYRHIYVTHDTSSTYPTIVFLAVPTPYELDSVLLTLSLSLRCTSSSLESPFV